jgi:hypothetical protein
LIITNDYRFLPMTFPHTDKKILLIVLETGIRRRIFMCDGLGLDNNFNFSKR